MAPWRETIARFWNRLSRQEPPRQNFRHAFRALAGTTITHENAFTLPAFYRGAALVSSAIAQLPWQVYRRKPDGGRERRLRGGVGRSDHGLHDGHALFSKKGAYLGKGRLFCGAGFNHDARERDHDDHERRE